MRKLNLPDSHDGIRSRRGLFVSFFHYWAHFAEYFSPWEDLASSGKGVEDARVTLEGVLDELPSEEKEIVY
jgi:hypothetical protein